MNLHHLRYFITLAHMQHYTQASAVLNITQPTLTYAINALEAELGVALFEKNGRNVTLTKNGRLFLKEIEPAMERIDHAVDTMKLVGQGKERLHLGFLPVLGVQYIPRMLSGFSRMEEGVAVTFQYHSGLTRDLLEMLQNRVCDLVFCSYEAEHPEFIFEPVVRQDLVVIVPEGHPLADRTEIDLKETAEYPQIFFHPRSGIRAIVDQLFQKIQVVPKIVMEAEEDSVIAGFVAEHFGIAVVPEMSVLDHLPVHRIRIIRPEWQRNFYMVYRKDAANTRALTELIRYIQEQKERANGIGKISL